MNRERPPLATARRFGRGRSRFNGALLRAQPVWSTQLEVAPFFIEGRTDRAGADDRRGDIASAQACHPLRTSFVRLAS